MKALCDVHLPKKLVEFLLEQGIEAVHGSSILNGFRTTDGDFCKYADEHGFVVITKDNDFRNSHFLLKTPRRLIKINLGNISNENLIAVFRTHIISFVKVFDHNSAYIEVGKDSVSVLIH